MVNLTCRGQVLEPFPGALNFTQFRKRSTTSRVCRQLCQRGLRKVSLSGHLISNSNGSTTAGTSTACRASPVKALGCVMLTHAKGSTSSSLHSSDVYHHAAAWREMRKSGSRGAEEACTCSSNIIKVQKVLTGLADAWKRDKHDERSCLCSPSQCLPCANTIYNIQYTIPVPCTCPCQAPPVAYMSLGYISTVLLLEGKISWDLNGQANEDLSKQL